MQRGIRRVPLGPLSPGLQRSRDGLLDAPECGAVLHVYWLLLTGAIRRALGRGGCRRVEALAAGGSRSSTYPPFSRADRCACSTASFAVPGCGAAWSPSTCPARLCST